MSGGVYHISYPAIQQMQNEFNQDAEKVRTEFQNLRNAVQGAAQQGLKGAEGLELESGTLPALDKDWKTLSDELNDISQRLKQTEMNARDRASSNAKLLQTTQG